MRVFDSSDTRNVAVIGHGHCGKTSLTSAMLFTAGATDRLLRVDDGNTITDFDEEEAARTYQLLEEMKQLGELDAPEAEPDPTEMEVPPR